MGGYCYLPFRPSKRDIDREARMEAYAFRHGDSRWMCSRYYAHGGRIIGNVRQYTLAPLVKQRLVLWTWEELR